MKNKGEGRRILFCIQKETYLTPITQSGSAPGVISMNASEILEVISELSPPLDHLPNGVPMRDVLKIQELDPSYKTQLKRDSQRERGCICVIIKMPFFKKGGGDVWCEHAILNFRCQVIF